MDVETSQGDRAYQRRHHSPGSWASQRFGGLQGAARLFPCDFVVLLATSLSFVRALWACEGKCVSRWATVASRTVYIQARSFGCRQDLSLNLAGNEDINDDGVEVWFAAWTPARASQAH